MEIKSEKNKLRIDELTELLLEKEENVNFTPTDNLDDNNLTMIH